MGFEEFVRAKRFESLESLRIAAVIKSGLVTSREDLEPTRLRLEKRPGKFLRVLTGLFGSEELEGKIEELALPDLEKGIIREKLLFDELMSGADDSPWVKTIQAQSVFAIVDSGGEEERDVAILVIAEVGADVAGNEQAGFLAWLVFGGLPMVVDPLN